MNTRQAEESAVNPDAGGLDDVVLSRRQRVIAIVRSVVIGLVDIGVSALLFWISFGSVGREATSVADLLGTIAFVGFVGLIAIFAALFGLFFLFISVLQLRDMLTGGGGSDSTP